jgi:hypothetical protein
MDIYNDQLRMQEPKLLPESASCYLVGATKFCKDLKEIEASYKRYGYQFARAAFTTEVPK